MNETEVTSFSASNFPTSDITYLGNYSGVDISGTISVTNENSAYTCTINSVGDMVALSYMVNSGWTFDSTYTFQLENDLDFSQAKLNESEETTSFVDNFEPIGNQNWVKYFSANFDGQNHTISNLKISATGTNSADAFGLFGCVISSYSSSIKDLNIDKANIQISNIQGGLTKTIYVGTTCAFMYQVYLTNVSVKNSNIDVNVHCLNNVGSVIGFYQSLNADSQGNSSFVTNCLSDSNTVRNENGYLGGFYGCTMFSNSRNFNTEVQNNTVKFWLGDDSTKANTVSNNTLITTSIAVDEIGLEYSHDASRSVNMQLLQSFESRNSHTNNNTIIRGKRFNGDALYLYTNKWNFVARVGETFDKLNSNILQVYNQTTNTHMDMGATNFVYGKIDSTDGANNWNTDFLYASDSMIVGAGYFVWPFNDTIGTSWNSTSTDSNHYTTKIEPDLLTSTPENNTYAVTNYGTTATGGTTTTGYWYAFGNPFDKPLPVSSLLDIANANSTTNSCVYISENEQVTQIQGNLIYVYDSYSNNWTELQNSNNDTILPGQGFMVNSGNESGKTANFHMIYPATNNQLPATNIKSSQTDRGIEFIVSFNGLTNSMFAKQSEGATDGFDRKDAYILFGTNPNRVEPYFVVDNNAVKHNRYNSDNYACDVNFHSQKSGVAELSVSDVPEGTTVSIVDLTMNTETVFESEPYQIEVEAGENANRYQIKINKGSVSLPQTIENEANISIWNNNKEIFVKGENLQRVEVYNTLGQMVYQKAISGEAYNFTFDNEGAYIIKAICSNGQSHVNNCTKTQKIVIR